MKFFVGLEGTGEGADVRGSRLHPRDERLAIRPLLLDIPKSGEHLPRIEAGDRKRFGAGSQEGLAADTGSNSGHQWPPIINLSEAGGYYFKSGSAELSFEFRDGLSGSIPKRIAKSTLSTNLAVAVFFIASIA